MATAEHDMMRALGPLAVLMVDPNSTTGLRLEGAMARAGGKPAGANPFTTSHPRSLAELHWWEGWWLEDSRLGGAKAPNMPAAVAFAKRQRAALPA